MSVTPHRSLRALSEIEFLEATSHTVLWSHARLAAVMIVLLTTMILLTPGGGPVDDLLSRLIVAYAACTAYEVAVVHRLVLSYRLIFRRWPW
jgi:Mn2+/Fe2+ NRAMP family transporter